MHEPTSELTRQTIPVRRRRKFAGILWVTAACLGTTAVVLSPSLRGGAMNGDVAPTAIPQSICAPVSLVVPPAPAVAEPAPIDPTDDFETSIAPPPLATSPTIDAACIFESSDDVACEWDDGFPAISADGTLIATKYIPDDNNRGNPGLTIRFVDTRTSRIVRDLVVLSPDEVETEADEQSPKLLAKIARRAADAQRTVDAGHYRPLVLLADGGGYDDEGGNSDEPTLVGTLRTELVGSAVRVVDTTTSKVVIQARFPIEAAFPKRATTTEDDCSSSLATREVDVWWDDATRNLYAEAIYASAPCYCGTEIRNYIRHAQ